MHEMSALLLGRQQAVDLVDAAEQLAIDGEQLPSCLFAQRALRSRVHA